MGYSIRKAKVGWVKLDDGMLLTAMPTSIDQESGYTGFNGTVKCPECGAFVGKEWGGGYTCQCGWHWQMYTKVPRSGHPFPSGTILTYRTDTPYPVWITQQDWEDSIEG